MEMKNSLSELQRGVLVFLALAVLTAVEYLLGVREVPSIFLWVIALLKAALVLVYFMHISRISGSDGVH